MALARFSMNLQLIIGQSVTYNRIFLRKCARWSVYHNFVLPHASLRQPLLAPEATNGRGSAKVWQPCTPAMAAGLTNHVWSLEEVLLFRVPPWPQPQVQ
jgi:hypothetical protein